MVYKTAEQMGKEQREISVAEFFEKNRHLLGFDNPHKALLTVVREAVDNSLDACEEAGILPEILVKLKQLSEDRVRVVVQDNGPGIVKEQIPRIFGKLLYGSKFFKLAQSRGQQGIGISAAVLYTQLTSGKPTIIRARVKGKSAYEFNLRIDTNKNEPQIIKEEKTDKFSGEHGIYIEMEIDGKYRKGGLSVDEYLKETALANPFANIIYYTPDGEKIAYKRVVDKLPKTAKSIKPHPYGVELGVFERMSKNTKARSVVAFLTNDFCRVGAGTAKQIAKIAKIKPSNNPKNLAHDEIEKLWKSLQNVKLMKPPLDCLSPVGEDVLEKAVKADTDAEFVAAITRPPAVYRGNPFGIEVCIGFGGNLKESEPAEIIRIANRVPLLYEASSCAIMKAMKKIEWRRYKIEHQNHVPVGPFLILVHMYSTWIPYTSEGKESIDAYPEILNEIKLALQDCLRKMGRFLSGRHRRDLEKKRQSLFEKYIPELANALGELTEEKPDGIRKGLEKMIKKEDVFIEAEMNHTIKLEKPRGTSSAEPSISKEVKGEKKNLKDFAK